MTGLMRDRFAPSLLQLLALAVITGLALSGCAVEAGDFDAAEAALAGSNAINPRPRGAVADGGNLRLPITAYPENWNTLHIDGNLGENTLAQLPMMPRSFHTDAAGNPTVNHDYFTDVQLTGTDPQQVTYTINPKAVWSDGSPITWEDLASQWQAMNQRDPRYLIAMSSGFDRVTSVTRGVDDRQAIVTFGRHYAEWRGQFSGNAVLYPKQVTATPEAFNTSLIQDISLTSGPFMPVAQDRAHNRFVLGRNPRWWGVPPKLDSITYTVLDDGAVVSALQNDEVDATTGPLSSLDRVRTARSAPGVVIRRAPAARWSILNFNGAPGSILADPKLRVAVAKAIDRKGIAKALQFGLTPTPQPLNNHVFVNGQTGYEDNSEPVAFDPETAASELDALGWRRVGDGREKDGRKLVIRDVFYKTNNWILIAKIIQQNLAKVGVQLVIDTRPSAGLFSDVFSKGDYDFAQYTLIGDAYPLSSLPQQYGLYPGDIQGNYGRIGSPELNALIDQTLSELDPAKAVTMANDADRRVFAEGHSLPLLQDAGNYAVRENLANYGAPGLASYDYTLIGFTK